MKSPVNVWTKIRSVQEALVLAIAITMKKVANAVSSWLIISKNNSGMQRREILTGNIHLHCTCTVAKKSLYDSCTADDKCSDSNAVCQTGKCQCQQDYYESASKCSKY